MHGANMKKIKKKIPFFILYTAQWGSCVHLSAGSMYLRLVALSFISLSNIRIVPIGTELLFEHIGSCDSCLLVIRRFLHIRELIVASTETLHFPANLETCCLRASSGFYLYPR